MWMDAKESYQEERNIKLHQSIFIDVGEHTEDSLSNMLAQEPKGTCNRYLRVGWNFWVKTYIKLNSDTRFFFLCDKGKQRQEY